MNDVSPIINSKYYINQSDSNVNYIQLGSSDDTIGSAGCYICSIAMIVCWYLGDCSDDTQKAIVKQMAKNCTSNGNYSGADIEYDDRTFRVKTITDVAQKLLDGYPSICKIKYIYDNSTCYHFVVINGYDTDNDGWAAYLVLDPGKRTAITLQDVIHRLDGTVYSKRFVVEV